MYDGGEFPSAASARAQSAPPRREYADVRPGPFPMPVPAATSGTLVSSQGSRIAADSMPQPNVAVPVATQPAPPRASRSRSAPRPRGATAAAGAYDGSASQPDASSSTGFPSVARGRTREQTAAPRGGPVRSRSANARLTTVGTPRTLDRSTAPSLTPPSAQVRMNGGPLALAQEMDRSLTASRARALLNADLNHVDIASLPTNASASNRLEQARQQMAAALQKHDAEFDRAVRLKEMDRAQADHALEQLERFNVIRGRRFAQLESQRQQAEAERKRTKDEQAMQRARNDAHRRRIWQQHEEMLEERRVGLLMKEAADEERLRVRRQQQDEDRLRRRYQAQEKSDYVQQVGLRNQMMIAEKAARVQGELSARQHDRAKAARTNYVRDRARELNEEKETRHRLARDQQQRAVEDLRVKQTVQEWEQALVDEEIERMRRVVREDRRNLDRALEQLRLES
eukprot:TRINITY_DN5217_c0_g1_i1.p1 TRINITY_DN5217_c0_g1~~TRINITY_DN5217_c0_g1_i1.p1  ORF type:complete len:457 (+),score=101.28 TRINITY_DN5217_c0_g1_i1:28-1398(+)